MENNYNDPTADSENETPPILLLIIKINKKTYIILMDLKK